MGKTAPIYIGIRFFNIFPYQYDVGRVELAKPDRHLTKLIENSAKTDKYLKTLGIVLQSNLQSLLKIVLLSKSILGT